MAADYQTIEAGETGLRGFTLLARANGDPIVSGTVNWYLKALSGANAGKWWRCSDGTWQATAQANAMTHQDDGHWTRDPLGAAASPFDVGVLFLEYIKESGDLHVPLMRMLKANHTPKANSAKQVTTDQLGGGARTVTITTTDGVDPLSAVTVRMTQGVESYVGQSNVDGEITFLLNDGDWDIAASKSGYSYTPEVLEVNGDETAEIELTQVAVTPSADPEMTTGFVVAYDEVGDPEQGVEFTFLIRQAPLNGLGISYDSTPRTAMSDENGLVEFTDLFKGVTYSFSRGTSAKNFIVTIPADAGATYELPSMVGEV